MFEVDKGCLLYAVAEMQKEGRVPAPPSDLLKQLGPARDLTRLRVLELLAARPWPTNELAGVMGH